VELRRPHGVSSGRQEKTGEPTTRSGPKRKKKKTTGHKNWIKDVPSKPGKTGVGSLQTAISYVKYGDSKTSWLHTEKKTG